MSSVTPHDLVGILPVFQTPYSDDDAIDFDTLAREIDWLYAQGSDGIVMAMVSEILRLSTDERELLTERACAFNNDRGPTIISIGAESTHTALRLARHAQGCGASAVMAIPPVSIGAMDSEVLSYYEQIIQAIDLPVIVQDASGYVGQALSVDLLAKLLSEFGERVLFKPEATPIGPRLSALRDATKGKARVFEGSGGIALVDSYRRGIVGTMPGADLIRGIIALYRALELGDDALIYRISMPLSALVAIQTGLDGFLSVEKYLLVKQGVFRNTRIRGPVGFVLDDETRQEVDRLFDLLNAELERDA